MRQWLADFVWGLIKDRVVVLIQEQAQAEKPRTLSRYAGSNRT
jgi:hypothetical protein